MHKNEVLCNLCQLRNIFSKIDPRTIERLGVLFDDDVRRIVDIVSALPESDYKYDLIHVRFKQEII